MVWLFYIWLDSRVQPTHRPKEHFFLLNEKVCWMKKKVYCHVQPQLWYITKVTIDFHYNKFYEGKKILFITWLLRRKRWTERVKLNKGIWKHLGKEISIWIREKIYFPCIFSFNFLFRIYSRFPVRKIEPCPQRETELG